VSRPPQQDLYPEVSRDDVRPFVPRDARSVLDVGCGPGGFGPTVRSILGADVRLVGVEAVPGQAARARDHHGYDEVVDGYFPEALGGRSERFDLICFNDVLEHIVDPWSLVRLTRDWVEPGGHVLAAIPSIQFAPIVWQLARGRWDYRDAGTLDRTHLRFFTRATMVEMFEQSGYRVVSCEGANPVDDAWRSEPWSGRRLVKTAMLPLLGDSRFVHFVVLAQPRVEGVIG
jgi:2-polyprenyl-3-methyl-5-hydroxy-6-metoxy-1,4-benzoquinol methylase